jgi:hypothetical protein
MATQATYEFVDINGAKIIVDETQAYTNEQIEEVEGKIPSKISALTNDSGFQTASQVTSAIEGKIDSALSDSSTNAVQNKAISAELSNIKSGSSITSIDASKIKGTISSSNLPSYVDDVVEYSSVKSFPTTGETGKIYVDTSTNLTYRYSGTSYVEISPSLALGETEATAYRGDYGAAAYAHAVTNKGTELASGLYKITTNAEGHVTAGTKAAKADITGLGIAAAQSVTAGTAGTTSATSGSTLDVPYVTVAADGVVSAYGTHKHTISGFLTSSSSLNAANLTGTVPSSCYTDTTYSDMTGATSSTAGSHGLVPAPAAGAETKFLCGNGTWQTPAGTTYSAIPDADILALFGKTA